MAFTFKNGVDQDLSSLDPLIVKALNTIPRDVVITSILRNSASNKAVGGAKGSKHLSGQAIDLRSRDLDQSAINDIVNHFSKYGINAGIHQSGTAPHLHAQLGGADQRSQVKPIQGYNMGILSENTEQQLPSSVDKFSSILDALGYKKPSKFQNIMQAISNIGYSAGAVGKRLSGDDKTAEYYRLLSQQQPGQQRQGMLAKLVMGSMGKPSPNDVQLYEYAMNQNKIMGLPIIPYDQWTLRNKKALGGSDDLSIDDMLSMIKKLKDSNKPKKDITSATNTNVTPTSSTSTDSGTNSDYGFEYTN